MAITEGAKKAHKQSLRRRVFNLRKKRTMKETLKELTDLISAKKKDEAQNVMPSVYQAIDKAAKHGVIKKQTAARKKARLSKKVASIQ